MLEGAAHRGDTAPDTLRGRHAGAEFLQGAVGGGAHRRLAHWLGAGPQAALGAPACGGGAPVPGHRWWRRRLSTDDTLPHPGPRGRAGSRAAVCRLG